LRWRQRRGDLIKLAILTLSVAFVSPVVALVAVLK